MISCDLARGDDWTRNARKIKPDYSAAVTKEKIYAAASIIFICRLNTQG